MRRSPVSSAVLVIVGVALLAALVQVAAPAAGPGRARAAVSGQRLALGMAHTCLITGEGTVRCSGAGLPGDAPVNLGPGRPIALAAGDFHTCAILAAGNGSTGSGDAGSVRCWGENRFGQLGYARTDDVAQEAVGALGPVDLGPGRTARALAAGSNFTCALLDAGDVRCWGGNSSGQLGLGTTTNVGDDETPAAVGPVNLGRRALAIAAGGFHACAVLDDGTVRCWGGNGTGELGLGNTIAVGALDLPVDHAPVRLGSGRTAVAVEAGFGTTCAILGGPGGPPGDVRCWGHGGQGALGLGDDESIGDDESPASVRPVRLGDGRHAVALALGAYHSCALLDDGTVRCWGPNGRGELGYGDHVPVGDAATPDQAGPVALDGRAVEIAAGGYHTCALLESDALRCWGPDVDGPAVSLPRTRAGLPADSGPGCDHGPMRRVVLVAVLALGLVAGSAPTGRAAEPAYLQPVTAITPPQGCVVLTPGMNGVKVRMVQQRLGMPDSAWETMDAATRTKVERFQKRKGLTVDGVVGQKTWAAMGFAEDFCMDRWTATPALGLNATSAQRIKTMIRFARPYLGGEYVWGGAGTREYGVDCSGLVLQALYRAGLDPQPITLDKHVLPAYRTSLQLYKHPRLLHVPFAQRQRGDLIFYRSNATGKVNHIGIYLGDGKILEAVSGPDTVRIGTVTTSRYGQTAMPTVVRPFA